jgi:hypothetical protein
MFRAIHDSDISWQEGSTSVLKLPEGVRVKIFSNDPAMGRIDMKVKFTPGCWKMGKPPISAMIMRLFIKCSSP